MKTARAWTEEITIPTYGIGKPNNNPMFFEKRVYQGSSGKVYPYPVIDTLEDDIHDRQYIGIYLENDYIKILILPELGGKIHRAFDKTNGYDFVYHNEVIKPALVGLLGPWVSGGIEFNWPQHHRPTTFMNVDFTITDSEGEWAGVKVHDYDRISGTSVVTEFRLYREKSFIEINSSVQNPTPSSQTFLWWANPAVAVNDNTQSIFPPDVHAVYDHGKRAVSRFPIACGEYYKYDYSEGVDISRYKNLPVPTSYMAYRSNYDFVGGYDYGENAGILHVADHHVSPGKKQWTWGCGDFGRAWDRNLTDKNGPYIELMTGMYTDNQPDFSWLEPGEEKHFTQYFLPYKGLGAVKNATRDILVNLETSGTTAWYAVYSTGVQEDLRIVLSGDKTYADKTVSITPETYFQETIENVDSENLQLKVFNRDGLELIHYIPEKPSVKPLPEPARAPGEPQSIRTNEELYLIGRHIEQYRHATYTPDPYYEEGLRRDPGDIRINTAMAELHFRRGSIARAETFCRKAMDRMEMLNTNPEDSTPHLLYGFILFRLGRDNEAFDHFYKATWTQGQAGAAYLMLAFISSKRNNWNQALSFTERALQYNSKNTTAKFLKAFVLLKNGSRLEAAAAAGQNLTENPFDYGSALILEKLEESSAGFNIESRIGGRIETYLSLSADFARCGCFSEALEILCRCPEKDILVSYHKALYAVKAGEEAGVYLKEAQAQKPGCRFAYTLDDQEALLNALRFSPDDGTALYLLGNLCYDKRRYDEALDYWERSVQAVPDFPTSHRNLSIVYFNKRKDAESAQKEMEKAFSCDKSDARVFYEQDQLYKKIGKLPQERLSLFEDYSSLITARDDLKVEYVTLLNLTGEYKKALDFMKSEKFHPWEGGEGKISSQYVMALRELALQSMQSGRYEEASEKLTASLTFPLNLGEGKLIGRKDNDIHYLLGLCRLEQGKKKEAEDEFKLATLGDSEPAAAMFYNDQPADMIFYQALAWRKLGCEETARSLFNKLQDYGEQHLFDDVKIDFFAVSLPDIQLFDDDLNRSNRIHCRFLIGLAEAGLGKKTEALVNFKNVLETDPSHPGAKMLMESPVLEK